MLMSGGSCNYVCYKIKEELCGRMEDAELNDLMKDIAELAHTLEWYLSCDYSKSSYEDAVLAFKKKWFKTSREERLKAYIDESLDKMRGDLYRLIGEVNADDT
jgi:hypothetical protein